MGSIHFQTALVAFGIGLACVVAYGIYRLDAPYFHQKEGGFIKSYD